ncbi:unnamed protein product [Phytomonas sp. Hart1]|nr:unnamed protein product [Phytomonas sp. Hart1]|eukprot:CCW69453.1 unnamed protein product [Phytomonas sp. isolate Hart1]
MPANSTKAAAPPALTLAPVRKTALDLFAVAPQAKKATRRVKAQMALEGGAAAPSPSPPEADDVFRSVVVEAPGAAPASAGPPSKRAILRHGLHANPEEDARTVFVGNLPQHPSPAAPWSASSRTAARSPRRGCGARRWRPRGTARARTPAAPSASCAGRSSGTTGAARRPTSSSATPPAWPGRWRRTAWSCTTATSS